MSDDHNETEKVDERIITLKIQIPALEDLEIPCSVNDTIFDVVETLKVLPSTREFTAYNLSFESEKLSEEVAVGELVKEGEDTIALSLVFAPYTEVSAREHIIKTREYTFLETKEQALAEIYGVCYGASTYSSLGLTTPVEKDQKESSEEKEEKQEESVFSVTDEEKTVISEIVSEVLENPTNRDAIVAKPNAKPLPALKSLYISQWSPADLSRKLAGDLMYLQVQTLESEIFYITAHVSGFFINRSSNSRFDGEMALSKNGRSTFNYSLIGLLKEVSPALVKQLEENEERLSKLPMETYIAPNATTVASPWLVQDAEAASADLGRSQYNLLHGGIDGSDLQVDWNKNFQYYKEFTKDNLNERIGREQSLISCSTEFTTAAVKGALSFIRGEIAPMNPEEDAALHICLRNGIFYSKAVDSIGQFQDSGDSEAARYAFGKDVAALKYLNRFDITGVHTLLTTVVDYAGERVLCQAPVPGILDDSEPKEGEEPEQTVKYGFIDDHSKVASDKEFVEKFKPVGEAFHLKPHKVWNKDGSEVVEVVTSAYTKGTKGNDGKSYIIDLFRTTPLDIEFIEANYDATKENSYPHKEALIRPEAINEWIKRETAIMVKRETEKLEKEGKLEGETKPSIGIDESLFLLNPDAFSLTSAPTPELAAELKKDEEKVREVSKFVNEILVEEFVDYVADFENRNAIDGRHLSELLHESGINIRYLGKVAELALKKKDEYLKQQEAKLAEIAAANKIIEEEEEKEAAEKKARLTAIIEKRNKSIESGTVDDAEYKKAIEAEEALEKEKEEAENNLTTELNTAPTLSLLDSLYELSVSEMIARATKHFLRKILHEIPLPLVSYVISHVHNCLISGDINASPEAPMVSPLLSGIYKDVDLSILEKDSQFVLAEISKEVFVRYRFALPENWINLIRKLPLMRSIALKFGIQWKNREYAFTKEALDAQIARQKVSESSQSKPSKKKGKKSSSTVPETQPTVITTTFVPSDIICLTPVIKSAIFESTAISDTWEAGIMKLSSDDKEQNQEGSIFASQTVQFAERLYGPVHNITASYYAKLGNLFASSNDFVDASLLMKKSFQIFERTGGIESFQASLALNQLANTYLSNNELLNVFKIYKRLLAYWTFAFDEYHPNVVNIFASIAIILSRLGMVEESVKVYSKAVQLSDKLNDGMNQKSALYRYQLSQQLINSNRFSDALVEAEKSFEAFKVTLGLKDKSTVDARKLVTNLKNYIAFSKKQAKSLQEKEHETRKLEQLQNIKHKQSQKAKKPVPNPDIANKSIEDILAFIDGPSSGKKKKNNNKKKNSKK